MKIALMSIILFCAFFAYAEQKCSECHQPQDVLPEEHEKVDFVPASCPVCHIAGEAGETDPFRSGMHLKHAENAECSVCHILTGEKPFTVNGAEEGKNTAELELISEITLSWQSSANLDKKHADGDVFCGGCHGEELPEFAAAVDNEVCLTCHGTLEELQKKTEPEEHEDRNPHKSHLGDIACNVCHLIHSEQVAYCVSCHPKFIMKMP